MKTVILSLTIMMSFIFTSCAQTTTKPNATKTADGNYLATTKSTTKFTDTITGSTYMDTKGIKYNVFKSKNNKLYVWKKSKKGTTYKYYIKFE